LDYIFTVFSQIIILFVLIAVGFALSKARLVTVIGTKQITNILFYVVTPVVIIDAMRQAQLDARSVELLVSGVIAGAASFIVCIPLSLLFFRKTEHSRKMALRFCMIFPNVGYFSLPLAKSLCGNEGVLICSAFIVVFNIFAFTYGISMFKSGVKPIKVLVNPGTAGLAIGLSLLVIKGFLPETVFQPAEILSGANPSSLLNAPLTFIAGMNTPLAMIVTGVHLQNTSMKIGRKDLDKFLVAAMRLAVLPWLALGICYALGLRGISLMAAAVPLFAPAASSGVMLATKYGGDTKTVSKTLPLTTLISGLTMPVMLGLVRLL